MLIIIFIIAILFIVSFNDIIDIIDEVRWQLHMLPARFWKQNYKTHRRFY